MNLFCFTLDGSTESVYEPAHSQTLKEVLPNYQCSPLLRRRAEWGGSDPSINSDRLQSPIKVKRNSRRSCLPSSSSEKDMNHACWMSSCDKKDLSHQKSVQNKETCKAPGQTRDDRVMELNSERTQTLLPAQGGETAADAAESTRKLKKLQNLVQTKKGHERGAGTGRSTSENNNMLSNSNPVLTCIGLGKKTEKPSKTAPSPRQQQATDVHEDSDEEVFWSPRVEDHVRSPFDCSQPWTPFYHTCHQPRPERWVCGGTLSLPRTTEWDRFESLIQELDGKQSDLSPPRMMCSHTDLHLTQNTLTRFGRVDAFRQQSSLMKPQDNRSSPQEQNGEPTTLRLQGGETEAPSQTDIKASSQKTLTAIIDGETQEDKVEKREVEGGRSLIKGNRRSMNSMESLFSLNSGQSSSSGVTSGSDCSSNRGSVRLEDEPSLTTQVCGRARVHTEFVPSPYDTESLKLKVGDVIDIITRPPMGIWTGMLNNRIGNFKFIYVDVLTEEKHEETQAPRLRHKCRSTIQRRSLEECSSSLQLNSYQTVDELMRRREHHLTELNVTDPEHRLLAAVDSLQQPHSDWQSQNEANQEAETRSENTKADTNNRPRDSGCHMPSDSPDDSREDTDLHFPSEPPPPAETAAS